jgi:hypothetical protein
MRFSRRDFVKTSMVASAAIPLNLLAQAPSNPETRATTSAEGKEQPKTVLPTGKIRGQEFSRLMLGGNLISGYSHARDLVYVAPLMRFYNTPAKIRETLEIAESNGINAINTFVTDDISALHAHWQNGGKMKWIAQVGAGDATGCPHIQMAVDGGATAIHSNGDHAEQLLARNQFERVGEIVEWTRAQKLIAGVSAHDLQVIIECEKLKVNVDFYQKTLHTLDYYTAPRADEKGPKGSHDNSWCCDPEAVIRFMAGIRKPWIAFKILAAGALCPRQAFPHAFNGGADFILVGMFDWQIVENVKLASRVVGMTMQAESKRTRPWCA